MTLILERNDPHRQIIAHVSGTLTENDYATFVPSVEKFIQQHGKINVVFDMRNFHGWEMKALWEDIKFDTSHFNDLERLAMVGESKWQEWMATFCKPFTTADIRYFDHDQYHDALNWASSGTPMQ